MWTGTIFWEISCSSLYNTSCYLIVAVPVTGCPRYLPLPTRVASSARSGYACRWHLMFPKENVKSNNKVRYYKGEDIFFDWQKTYRVPNIGIARKTPVTSPHADRIPDYGNNEKKRRYNNPLLEIAKCWKTKIPFNEYTKC